MTAPTSIARDPVSQPLLAIDNVIKNFGTRNALRELSLQLAAGEVFALLGPNGAGKTTTINLILGFLKADAGRVSVCGFDVATASQEARRHIAYIPEQVALYPAMSGLENLRYFTTLAGLALPRSRLEQLLSEAGLAPEAHVRKASGYSKGMRQKVGIAVAIAREASVLLLDEPTSGLDPSASAEFSSVVRAAAARGTAVLMATHDLYRIKEIADRVGVLHNGRISKFIDPATCDHVELERLYIESLGAGSLKQ
jgi:ABC-2 type transport system ATP-binding protein